MGPYTPGPQARVFGGVFALAIDNTVGSITLLDSLLGPVPTAAGVTGTGVLARISFTTLAPGSTIVGLSGVILEASSGAPIAAAMQSGPSGCEAAGGARACRDCAATCGGWRGVLEPAPTTILPVVLPREVGGFGRLAAPAAINWGQPCGRGPRGFPRR
jgi:hypothetical protein